MRDLARSHGMDAIRVLAEIMSDREAPPPARVSAAIHLLDRGYGKPTQEVSGPDGGPVQIFVGTGIDRAPE